MEKKDLLSLVEEILKLPRGVVKYTDLLVGFGNWDSLSVLEFITEVDKKYGIIVSPAEISKAKTVAELLALVK